MTDRSEFVRGFIETLQEEGYSHEQCKKIASVVASLADQLPPEEFKKLGKAAGEGNMRVESDKLAGVPISSVLAPLRDLGIAGLGAGANIAGNIGRGLIQAGPAAAMLGVAAPAAMGYGLGHAAAGLFDDPDKVISEAKHRELVERLRDNARQLRQQSIAQEDESSNERSVY